MVALPKDFSQDWWKKNKPATLKPTGFGEALLDFEGWYKSVLRGSSSYDSHQRTFQLLKAVETARAAAVGKCNKILHADALKQLEAYKKLIAKASQDLQRVAEDYDRTVKEQRKARADLVAALKGALLECAEIMQKHEPKLAEWMEVGKAKFKGDKGGRDHKAFLQRRADAKAAADAAKDEICAASSRSHSRILECRAMFEARGDKRVHPKDWDEAVERHLKELLAEFMEQGKSEQRFTAAARGLA